MRILYIGHLFEGATGQHRMEALQELGHQVVSFDTGKARNQFQRWRYALLRRLGICWDYWGLHHPLAQVFRQQGPFDLVWVDKGLTLPPKTLKIFQGQHPPPLLIHYSPDDMYNPQNQSPCYLQGIGLYDWHITTKSYNQEELLQIGAQRVLFVNKSFNPAVHRPLPPTDAEVAQWQNTVAFVGTYEQQRFQQLNALAQSGVNIRIFGGQWQKVEKQLHPNITVWHGFLANEGYARILSAAPISLCFLRKVNRDLQTARTMEIPACGGFMLGERTEEHQKLFEEGKEAEFFASTEELIDKAHYYLSHPEERKAIAEAGRKRCWQSGYDNAHTLQYALDQILSPQPTDDANQ